MNLLKKYDQILLVGGKDRPAPTDQFEKGAALADDQTCYFIIGWQEKLYLGAYTPPGRTSIVLPVGYMNQPTGLLHIYL